MTDSQHDINLMLDFHYWYKGGESCCATLLNIKRLISYAGTEIRTVSQFITQAGLAQNVGELLVNHIINHFRPANVLLSATLKTVPFLVSPQCGSLCHISIIKWANSKAVKPKYSYIYWIKIPDQLYENSLNTSYKRWCPFTFLPEPDDRRR